MTTSDVIYTNWHPRTLFNETAGSQPAPEELREQARNEGYAEGYNEGLEAGKKESLERSSAEVAQLKSLIDALDQPFKKTELVVSEYLLSLVLAVCKSVLRRELSADVEHIQNTLDHALELLSGERGDVRLTLHPDDFNAVTDNWSDDMGELKITSAPEITRGGCLIQRNDSLVDATIESQLSKIISDLSIAPGLNNSSGDSSDSLDATKINIAAKRLEEGANFDE